MSEVNKLFLWRGKKTNDKNRRALDWLDLFHQKQKQAILSVLTTVPIVYLLYILYLSCTYILLFVRTINLFVRTIY